MCCGAEGIRRQVLMSRGQEMLVFKFALSPCSGAILRKKKKLEQNKLAQRQVWG